jgi:hypothetical protein
MFKVVFIWKTISNVWEYGKVPYFKEAHQTPHRRLLPADPGPIVSIALSPGPLRFAYNQK